MHQPPGISLADLSAGGLRLRPTDAVTIVRELALQVSKGDLPGVPSAHVIRLSPAGDITVEGPVVTSGRPVPRAAQLLAALLPSSKRTGDASPLLHVVSRALGEETPGFASLDEFAAALAPFAAHDSVSAVIDLTTRWAEAVRAAEAAAEADAEDDDDPNAVVVSDMRRARRETGLSLVEISKKCRIPVSLLRQLEWGYLKNWPIGRYGRAELVRYARAAGLDKDMVIRAAWPLIEAEARQRARDLATVTRPDAPVSEAAVAPAVVSASTIAPEPSTVSEFAMVSGPDPERSFANESDDDILDDVEELPSSPPATAESPRTAEPPVVVAAQPPRATEPPVVVAAQPPRAVERDLPVTPASRVVPPPPVPRVVPVTPEPVPDLADFEIPSTWQPELEPVLFGVHPTVEHRPRRSSMVAAAATIGLLTGAAIWGMRIPDDGDRGRATDLVRRVPAMQPQVPQSAAAPAPPVQPLPVPEPAQSATPAVMRTVGTSGGASATPARFTPVDAADDDTLGTSPAFASAGGVVFASPVPSASASNDTDPGLNLRIMRVVDDGSKNYHARPSPDGKRVAFDSDRDGVRGVFIADADGRNLRRVSGDGFAAVPSWSPDGHSLAFSRAEEDRPEVWNLWVLNVDSGDTRRLTSNSSGRPWGASWFPDGQRLAYTHGSSIVVFDLPTSRQMPYELQAGRRTLGAPAVSPDGRWVMFQTAGDGGWLLDLTDRSFQKVLSDPSAEDFTWSPDGGRVAYYSRRDGEWNVWVMATR